MLCLLIDPYLIYLPECEICSADDVLSFFDELLQWDDLAEFTDDFEVIISKECHQILGEHTDNFPWNIENIGKLIQVHQIKEYDPITVYRAVSKLSGRIFDAYLRIQATSAPEKVVSWDWDTANDEITTIPESYLTRLDKRDPSGALKKAYLSTLGRFTFLIRNSLVQDPELNDIAIISPLSDLSIEQVIKSILRVNSRFVFEPPDYPGVLENRELYHEFSVFHTPEAVTQALGSNAETQEPIYQTGAEALQSARTRHFGQLIVSRKATDTASRWEFRDPDELFQILCGLVTVFLPAYEKNGIKAACREFQATFGRTCEDDESNTVKNETKYSQDYQVSYKGRVYFCGIHVRLGSRTRVNFTVIQDDGIDKILLARVGRHGKNTLS